MTDPKPKLLLVAPYFPPHPGGLEFYAQNLALQLAGDFNWEVVVVTTAAAGEDYSVSQAGGYKLYRLPYQFKLSNSPLSLAWFWRLRQIINTERPDVINVHAPVPGLGDMATLVSGRVPVVVTYHAGSMRKGRNGIDALVGIYETVLMRLMLGRARAIITSSEFVRRNFLGRYQAKSLTISPGVDADFFKPAAKSSNNLQGLIFVAALGKAEQYKGLRTLLEALPKVAAEFPQVHLTVVGEGDMSVEYEQLAAELGLNQHVGFGGRLTGTDLVRAYQAATVLVLPTSNDSFPMVIAEAMATGLAVISTAVGGIPEILTDGLNGVVVQPNDPDELAAAIMKLLGDPGLTKQLGEAGRQLVRESLSWQNRAAITDRVLRSQLPGSKPRIVQVAAYYPPHLGGMERVVEEISSQLASTGHDVTVLTSKLGGRPTNMKFTPNLSIKRLRGFEVAHTAIIPGLWWQVMRVKKPALVHLHLAQAYVPEMVWLAAKLRQLPYVVHYHLDVEPSGRLGFVFLWWKRWVQPRILHDAAWVITLSPEQSQLVVDRYHLSPERVSFIPNGVGEQFLAIGREKRTYHRPLRLLFVGRLAVQKRPERLVAATAQLGSKVTLELVGSGEADAELKAQVAEFPANNVIFRGSLVGDDLLEAYRRADVFVLPSDREGMPLAMLEAMATGLPVVGSNVQGIREHLAGVGLLVNQPSAETFASAISELVKDPEKLIKLGHASFAKAKSYSWASLAEQLSQVYAGVNRDLPS